MKEIIDEFNKDESVFAYDAVAKAKENKELASDILLDNLKEFVNNIKDYKEKLYPISTLYSIFLLAEFKDKRLFPILIDIINNKEIDSDKFFGDVVTEWLSSIIVSVFDDDFKSLNSVIENKEIDEYIRGSFLDCYIYFYENNIVTKEEIEKYLKKLIKLYNHDDDFIFYHIEKVIINTHLFSMMSDVNALFKYGLIDTFIRGDYVDFVDDIFNYNSTMDKIFPIEDIVKSISGWACFKNTKSFDKKSINDMPKKLINDYNGKNKKVGRNDPCPCGSGKKYKKCCLDKEQKQLPYQKYINEKLTRYPKRKENNDQYDLYDFYKEEFIEIDELLYKALKCKGVPLFVKRDMNKENKIDFEYLKEAYVKIKDVVSKNNFKTIEDYHKEGFIHYSLYQFYAKYSGILVEFIKNNYNMDKVKYIEMLEEITNYFYDTFDINADYEAVFLNRKRSLFKFQNRIDEAIEYFLGKLKKCSLSCKYEIYEILFDLYLEKEDMKSVDKLIDNEDDEDLKEYLFELKMDYFWD